MICTGDLWDEVTKRNFGADCLAELFELRKRIMRLVPSGNEVIVNILSEEQIKGLWDIYDRSVLVTNRDTIRMTQMKELVKSILTLTRKDEAVQNLWSQYDNLLKKCFVSDNLEVYLGEKDKDVFYYMGVNDFVKDYYKKNPNSEWKIKAILQFGFPFDAVPTKTNDSCHFCGKYLETRKWSLFIFTKKTISKIVIGFDDRNTFSNLNFIREQRCSGTEWQTEDLPEDQQGSLFIAYDPWNDDRDRLITEYLNTERIPVLTNAQYKKLRYSFTEIPSECFRIDYLDYLSRYKKSVVDLFGYPDKGEKIKKLKNVVEFINEPRKEEVCLNYNARKNNVFIKDFFFKNKSLKPTVLIGEPDCDYYPYQEFKAEYEIHSYDKEISPYYLYCLLSSEFISDYYSERYEPEEYSEGLNCYTDSESPLPLKDCIYIEMSPEKMRDKKFQEIYERNINPKLKVHDMIDSHEFNNDKAKDSIKKYLVEIKNDIDAGSFYSATILMGSVLEAFLIDWLGEIDGKNYFREPLRVNKDGREQNANFYDYIRLMREKCPRWTKGLEAKADEIRTKRNRVHAKLYIEEGEISHDKCYEVLRDLEAIINNRWNK